MKTVFADTFYFLAMINVSDSAHTRAVDFTSNNDFRMVTTEWVLTELADGLSHSLRGRKKFMDTLADLKGYEDTTIVACNPTLWQEGISLYSTRPDKEWSLTDCISFVVMKKEGLTEALTGDKHFEQAGLTALLK